MGDTLTEIQAYAQDVANFSAAVTSDFQAISSTFPALLTNFQSLLAQVKRACLRLLLAPPLRRQRLLRLPNRWQAPDGV